MAERGREPAGPGAQEGRADAPGAAAGAPRPDTPDAPSGEPPHDAPGRGSPPMVAMVADLMLVAVCAWFLWSDVAAARAGEVSTQPRTWTFMLNMTCTFVLVHRSMVLLQSTVPGAAHRGVGVVKWVMAIVLPLLAAAGIERQVHQAHRVKLDSLVADVVTRAQASIAESGVVTAAALSSLQSPYLRSLSVRTDTGAFAIEATVPAIGAEGYTAHYSSNDPRWRLDAVDEDTSTAHETAVGPTLSCAPSDAGLRCR